MYDLIDRAIGFAAQAHDGQRRKVGTVPYIAHPVAVAMLLQRLGCPETIIAAALLHDTVEDTNITLADIRLKFGDEVTAIVAGCTEIKGPWEKRKETMIGALREAPLPVKLVAAADKYHNLIHLAHETDKMGAAVWQRFGRGRDKQAWYYHSMLQSVLANVADPDQYAIFGMLQRKVVEVFGPAPSSERPQ